MANNKSFLSIIIPTYARPQRLAACLGVIAHLDFPRERFEVIVVDDGSETSPDAEVDAFRGRLDITLLNQSHAGPAKARNTGAAHARGTYLVFTDDDCRPSTDWLQNLAMRFSDIPDCAIGGCTINALHDNPYSSASQMLIDYLYSYYNDKPSRSQFFTTSNLALPSDRFHSNGGFDTKFPRAAGEDREFCDRWLHHGYRMVYAPEVIVYHAHPLKLLTFWKQHFNYGRGASCFQQVRNRRSQERIRLESISFYLNLLRYPFSQKPGRRALRQAALIALTQVANTAGFFWERGSNNSHKALYG